VGTEDIIVDKTTGGNTSITTHIGGNIFVPTKIYNAASLVPTTGWKLNLPTVYTGSMETSFGIAWSGDNFGSSISIYDTKSGVVFETSVFYDD